MPPVGTVARPKSTRRLMGTGWLTPFRMSSPGRWNTSNTWSPSRPPVLVKLQLMPTLVSPVVLEQEREKLVYEMPWPKVNSGVPARRVEEGGKGPRAHT